MQNRSTRNFTRLAFAIVVAALVLAAAALSYKSFETTITKTSTSVSVSLVTSVTISTTTTISTATVTETTTMTSNGLSSCVQLESAPMFLIVKNSSTGAPISSLPVQVEELPEAADPCSTTGVSTLGLGTMETNVNGSIDVCCTGSTFFFRFVYQGTTYHVNELANGAESAECVTFYVPSNMTTITYPGNFVYYC